MLNYIYIAVSLDGYIADKDGNLDWLPQSGNVGLEFANFIQLIDAIIMGKNTYNKVCSFGGDWPYTKHVFVLSNLLKELPIEHYNKVTLLQGSPTEILKIVRQKNYHNVYIDGGVNIQNFLYEDLIDEMIITTIPVLLGGGYSLFGKLPNHLRFKHVKTAVANNLVQNHYKRER